MFRGWEYFYSMVGQAAATLIGLMFVIVTLAATLFGKLRRERIDSAVKVYLTPTLVHFGAALLVALIALIPEESSKPVLVGLAVCGLAGLAYVAVTGIGISSSRQPLLDPSDRSAHAAYVPVPAIAYLLIVVSSVLALAGRPFPRLAVGVAAVILLGVGIRNAWGMALFVTRTGLGKSDANDDP